MGQRISGISERRSPPRHIVNPRVERTMTELYPCTRCEVEVTDDVEALQCDLCSGWEHRGCIKECDRPSVELYAALTNTQSRVGDTIMRHENLISRKYVAK